MGGHGDSARHCRHRDKGGPVLPVKGPVVPVAKDKTEMPFLFGQQNNSRRIYKKFWEFLHKVKQLTIHLSRLLSKVAWLTNRQKL